FRNLANSTAYEAQADWLAGYMTQKTGLLSAADLQSVTPQIARFGADFDTPDVQANRWLKAVKAAEKNVPFAIEHPNGIERAVTFTSGFITAQNGGTVEKGFTRYAVQGSEGVQIPGVATKPAIPTFATEVKPAETGSLPVAPVNRLR